jgi:hypothetical protein
VNVTNILLTDLMNALPANSFVNTNAGNSRRETIENRKSVASQRSGKAASTTMGDGVFRGVRAKELA